MDEMPGPNSTPYPARDINADGVENQDLGKLRSALRLSALRTAGPTVTALDAFNVLDYGAHTDPAHVNLWEGSDRMAPSGSQIHP
jgi:hypothetical protein